MVDLFNYLNIYHTTLDLYFTCGFVKLPVRIYNLYLLNYHRHRTRLRNSSNSAGEEFNEVIDEDPGPSTSADQNTTTQRIKTVNTLN